MNVNPVKYKSRNFFTKSALIVMFVGLFSICALLGNIALNEQSFFEPILLILSFQVLAVSTAISLCLNIVGTLRREPNTKMQKLNYGLLILFFVVGFISIQLT